MAKAIQNTKHIYSYFVGLNKHQNYPHPEHLFEMSYGTTVPFYPHTNDPYRLITAANTCT